MADLYVPDFVNTLAQADQAAAFAKGQQRQNALASFMSQSGDALMQGDTNALAQFARLDPMAAMQIQKDRQEQQWRADDRGYNRQQDAIANQRADRQFAATEARQARQDGRADEEWKWKLDAHMRGLKDDERAAQTAELEGILSGAAYFYQTGDKDRYNKFLQSKGIDPAEYPFEEFPAHVAQFKPVLDAMESFKPEVAEPADEYQRYAQEEQKAGRQPLDRISYANAKRGGGFSVTTPDGTKVSYGDGGSDNKKLTDSQSKLTLFQTMQNETAPVLAGLEEQWNPANAGDAAAAAVPIAGNYWRSQEAQLYSTAASAWAEGALRIATGAAATQPEIERIVKTYFAVPGDSPKTVAFKRQMRGMYERSIQSALGETPEGSLPVPMQPQGDRTALPDGSAALQAPVPSAANPSAGGTSQSPQVGEVRKGYRFKGGNPADPNSWEKQ